MKSVIVIPAKAGIQPAASLDSRLRGNDDPREFAIANDLFLQI
jgi:hypothetical protein